MQHEVASAWGLNCLVGPARRGGNVVPPSRDMVYVRWRKATLKTQVFVLIPYDTPPAQILEHELRLLEQHRFNPDDGSKGRWDYLVGAPEKTFQDTAAEGRLPAKVRRSLSGKICEMANLPSDIIPSALVTPDGVWHDLSDFGWKMINAERDENTQARKLWATHYQDALARYRDCWVLVVWAHS